MGYLGKEQQLTTEAGCRVSGPTDWHTRLEAHLLEQLRELVRPQPQLTERVRDLRQQEGGREGEGIGREDVME